MGEIKRKRIAILGLAFKPETDDIREAVSIEIIEELLKEEAEVSAYDPKAIPNTRKIFEKRIKYAPSMLSCLKGADGCILVTEWDEFKTLKPEDLNEMRTPVLIDGRRILDPLRFRDKAIYEAIGLGPNQR